MHAPRNSGPRAVPEMPCGCPLLGNLRLGEAGASQVTLGDDFCSRNPRRSYRGHLISAVLSS